MENKNNYDQIDFCLNTLYDCVYNESSEKCYTIKPIIKSLIKLHDLKKDNNFNCDEIFRKCTIKFINKVKNRFLFKRTSDSTYPCTISIGSYSSNPNYGGENDLGREEMINIAMMYMLSETVINDKLNHILLPIMMFDISGEKIKKLMPDITTQIKELDDKHELYVLITEHYFKMTTLREYLKNNLNKMTLNDWKCLFFQVLYTLSKLNEKFNKFRHNSLDLDAIFIYEKKENNNNDIYKLGSTTFKIPNKTFDIKIGYFDKSYTSDYIKNKGTTNITENPYYDIHYFFNSLYIFLKENDNIPDMISGFINEMVPEKFRIEPDEKFKGLNENMFDNLSNYIIVPSVTLKKNKFFSEFIEGMDLSASPVQNNKLDLNELNYKESGIDYLKNKNSISESSNDEYSKLNKTKILDRKKSKQYYRNMIKGSRKIVVPGLTMSESPMSEGGDIFTKTELKNKKKNKNSIKTSKLSTEYKVGNPELTSSDSEDINKDLNNIRGRVDESSMSESRLDINTYAEPESDVFKTTKHILEGIKKRKHNSKKSRKQKRLEAIDDKDDEDSEDIEIDGDDEKEKKSSSSSSSSSSASISISSSSSSDDKKKHKNKSNENSLMSQLDPKMKNKLSTLPDGFVAEVPDYMSNRFPDLGQGMQMSQGMGMPQEMGMPMPMPMQMPQDMGMPMGMPQGMPMGMPQGMPMGMPQGMPMGMPQGMPQGMPMGMPQGMLGQDPMSSMLGVPMMNQNMGTMMGGGNKLKKYYLKKDNDFFF